MWQVKDLPYGEMKCVGHAGLDTPFRLLDLRSVTIIEN
jgi:hypothetical protein